MFVFSGRCSAGGQLCSIVMNPVGKDAVELRSRAAVPEHQPPRRDAQPLGRVERVRHRRLAAPAAVVIRRHGERVEEVAALERAVDELGEPREERAAGDPPRLGGLHRALDPDDEAPQPAQLLLGVAPPVAQLAGDEGHEPADHVGDDAGDDGVAGHKSLDDLRRYQQAESMKVTTSSSRLEGKTDLHSNTGNSGERRPESVGGGVIKEEPWRPTRPLSGERETVTPWRFRCGGNRQPAAAAM
uniref:Uncharacterized protein n=1 Tax=Oryza nivara TaxID=4536 RepID=A0A0E0G3C5_ORYNI